MIRFVYTSSRISRKKISTMQMEIFLDKKKTLKSVAMLFTKETTRGPKLGL